MKRFKELKFVTYSHGDELQLNMLIPGVNSGVYTPSLHIRCAIKKKLFSRWRRASITLSINDVRELRDECNLILKEAEYQRRINKENEK